MLSVATKGEPDMVAGDVPSILISTVEAALLASLLGGRLLLGIEDPFQGWLAEDVPGALDRARAALAERGLIELGANSITVDTMVAALVGTWAHAEASLLASTTPAHGRAEVRHFHLARHLGVERVPVAGCTHRLIALPAAEAVCRRVLLSLRLGGQRAAPGPRVVMPETLLVEARTRAAEAGPEAASLVLERAGVELPASRPLAESLADPIATGALVAMARRITSWEVGGVVFLEGREGLWRLRSLVRGGEHWVEALPCDADRGRQEVWRVVNRVLPEPPPGMEGWDRCKG